MLAGLGVMAKPVGVALVTLRVAVAGVTPGAVAVMVVVPADTAVASPLVGAVSLIVANEVTEELQSTVPVIGAVLLSLYVPIAMNCCVVMGAIVALGGLIAIETSLGAIVSCSDPVFDL
jgi:hypothetical protein